MTTFTIGAPTVYIENVHRTAHNFVVALLGLNGSARHRSIRTKNPACSMASAYADVLGAGRHLADSLPRPTVISSALMPSYHWIGRHD
jgi:hypothetical protein